jgi:hypothetical protein
MCWIWLKWDGTGIENTTSSKLTYLEISFFVLFKVHSAAFFSAMSNLYSLYVNHHCFIYYPNSWLGHRAVYPFSQLSTVPLLKRVAVVTLSVGHNPLPVRRRGTR